MDTTVYDAMSEPTFPPQRGIAFVNAMSFEFKTYFVAMFNTFWQFTPQYSLNTFKWLKTAIIDAPCRLMLDIDIEQLRLKREYISKIKKGNLSEDDVSEKNKDD
jgi:hypothetical protein